MKASKLIVDTVVSSNGVGVDSGTVGGVTVDKLSRRHGYFLSVSNSNTTGLLIDTTVNINFDTMVRLEIRGYSYGTGEVVNTDIVFYRYAPSNAISNAKVRNSGRKLRANIFLYNNTVHLYIKNLQYFEGLDISCYQTNGSAVYDVVLSLTPAIPTTGVTLLTTPTHEDMDANSTASVWHPLTLVNGWRPHNPTWGPIPPNGGPGYYVHPNGLIELSGLIANPAVPIAGGVFAYMPKSLAPTSAMYTMIGGIQYAASIGISSIQLQVSRDGVLTIYSAASNIGWAKINSIFSNK